ncbi:MAG: phospholipase D family protein, partial [bacterium]|nr:phospholipase D family protein [bacterium]
MSLTLNPAPRLASASSVALSLLLSIACASLPQDFDRAPSFALNNRPGTYLGEVFSDCAATTPGESAIALLDTGRDALMARLALIEAAEHSIDAQYFLWFGDDSGRLLMESLLRAADRGVRVRLLLDDGRANYPDLPMNLIDLHPSVEVRVFNPFGSRRSNLSRTFEMIGNMGRLQHRMHNKLLAIDSLVAVVGGRNIGNKYFGLDPEYNFRDLDVLALGSVVPPHLDSFDDYWNCEWSYPLNVFENRGVDTAAAAELRARLRDEMNSLDDFPYRIDVSSHAITSELHRIRERLVWAPAEVVFDVPSEIMENVSSDFVETVNQLVIEAQHEVLLSAPYLSPPDDSLEAIELAMQRGVTHRVLTNSLASTNLLAAHSVYTKYRKNLLRIGFEI